MPLWTSGSPWVAQTTVQPRWRGAQRTGGPPVWNVDLWVLCGHLLVGLVHFSWLLCNGRNDALLTGVCPPSVGILCALPPGSLDEPILGVPGGLHLDLVATE